MKSIEISKYSTGNAPYGATNADNRIILDSYGAQALAPWNKGSGNKSCYDGGNWSAVQSGNTVHITVKDYDIDVDNMPLKNGDVVMGAYGGLWESDAFPRESYGLCSLITKSVKPARIRDLISISSKIMDKVILQLL